MPYRTDTMTLDSPFLDRRVKLIPCKIEMVKYWYGEGESIRSIARRFSVDKRNIQFILFPERKEKNIQDKKERGGSKNYYDRKYHNEKMKEHRRYKYKTLSNGKL